MSLPLPQCSPPLLLPPVSPPPFLPPAPPHAPSPHINFAQLPHWSTGAADTDPCHFVVLCILSEKKVCQDLPSL